MTTDSKLITIILMTLIVALVGATSPVAAQPSGELGPGTVDLPSQTSAGEEVTIESSAEIPRAAADWSGELDVKLYVDGNQVGTQEISVSDGESVDISIQHQFQESGEKEVYFEIDAKLTREGKIDREGPLDGSTDPVDGEWSLDGSTDPVTIDITPEQVTTEGAAFRAPESVQNEVDEIRDDIPQATGPHAFVLTSSDELYVVLSDKEPEEGYASVEGFTPPDTGVIETDEFEFGVLVASDVEFESPTQASVSEVNSDTEAYNRRFVEINAHHRNIGIDYKEGPPMSAGILVADPLETSDLFGSVGSNSRSVLDENFDGSNIESVLGSTTQDKVVTTSYGTEEYWTNGEVTISGIMTAPGTTARDFIQSFREEDVIPGDSSTPVMYVIERDYNAEEVNSISEISENAAEFDGELVSVESNFFQTRISSERVFQSATGTPLPVDVILHGGAAWDQVPQSRDDVMLMMAASSVEQREYIQNRTGSYQIIGEVISTDRIEGNLPDGSILIIYDLERVGGLDTVANDIIENQASGVSNTLEQQANPNIDASEIEEKPDDTDEEIDETEDETEDTVDETEDETEDTVDETEDETEDTVDETAEEQQESIEDVVEEVDESEASTESEIEIESVTDGEDADESFSTVDTSEKDVSVQEITFDEEIGGSVTVEEYTNEDVIETTTNSIEQSVRTDDGGSEEVSVDVATVSQIDVDEPNTAATVTMSVDADEVDDPQEVSMYHETDNGWEKLSSEVEETDDKVTVSAETDGFSLFAVAEVETFTETESDDDGGILGTVLILTLGLIPIVLPIIVIVVVGVFIKRLLID